MKQSLFLKKIINLFLNFNILISESYSPSLKTTLFSILIFFISKNIIILILKKIQINLIYLNQKTLSVKLLNIIFKTPFIEFNKKKPESYVNIFLNDISQITNAGLSSVISLINEGFIILILWSSLMLIYPSETLVILLFYIPVTFILTKLISNTSKYLGNKRQKFELKILELLNSFLLSFKEVKIYNLGLDIVKDFSVIKSKAINIASWNSLIQQLNKYIIEIQIIVSVVIISIYLDYNLGEIKSFLIAFLFVSIKIIPSLSVFMTSFSNLKYAEASYNMTSSTMSKLVKNTSSESNLIFYKENFNKIVLEKVNFSYDSKSVIKDFSHTFEEGSKTLIMGKSGVGKSTLMNLITGLIQPEKGAIYKLKSTNDLIAYCTQSPFIFNGSIRFNITLNSKVDLSKLDQIINICHLNNFISSKKDGLDHIIINNGKDISGGQLKRIALARALYSDRKVLLLDEVTNGLDAKTKHQVVKELFKLNKTIILISHDEDLKKYFSQIIILNENN